MNKIKVLLVDDHAIFRKGVKSLLEEESDIEIIGEANDGAEAVEMVEELSPDVLMIDISMPRMSGIEAAEVIHRDFKQTRSLILSMHNNDDYIIKAVECGAHGYLLKDTGKEEMLRALRTVANGDKYFAGTVSKTIVNEYLSRIGVSESEEEVEDSSDRAKLSRKEKVILKFIIEGLNSREIAEKLDLSGRTVNNHRANMMKKMNVRNAAELVRLAIEQKLIN